MLKWVSKFLKVYQDEVGLFLWSTILLFLIRSASLLFDNFAETAFLKRFGVEYLPVVYMVNSVSTFFIMGLITGVMGRLPGSRLLMYLLGFCGASVAGLRLVIPLGIDLVYPVLFILKAQYEALLALVFWNLANDLFNTRQSKRLFPLITAGGVIGGIVGSFGTPFLVRAFSQDNLLLAYLVIAVIAAAAVKRMGTLFPTLLVPEKETKKGGARSSFLDEFRKVVPIVKESRLVKLLVVLTFLPNVVIPILNYQFNFAIDQTFATEGGMIKFFGYFRGVLNIINLIILLFVGRVYGRWGLPVALMFHPFNYVIVFLGFLLRFDILSAMYARITTTVLRTTINNPARAVLMGLFPASYRAVIRPFLRGTVVRVGTLMGSGFIMASEGWLHPKYLSVLGMIFVGGWVVSTVSLKKSYSGILLDLISRNLLELKALEEKELDQVFRDGNIQSRLLEAFLTSSGEDSVWYARLLRSLKLEALDSKILDSLRHQEDSTKIALLSLLSPKAGPEAVSTFRELAASGKKPLMIAVLQTANRLPEEVSRDFCREVFDTSPDPEVKAHAISALYGQEPEKYKPFVEEWLESGDLKEKSAGAVAAAESSDPAYIPKLLEILGAETDAGLLALTLKALHRLQAEEINQRVLPYLAHAAGVVRAAALEAFQIDGDDGIRKVISMMDDPSERVYEMAKRKIAESPYQNPLVLVESLTIPRRKVREGIFELLESLNIKDLDVFRFARSQLESAYESVVEAEALRRLPESRERDLLLDHVQQKRLVRLENIVRVLAIQDRSGRMRLIWRGLSSVDPRQRSNSLEAFEDSMDASLSRIMMPLLEERPPSESLPIGRKNFRLPVFDSNPAALWAHFLSEQDWVTVTLSLGLVLKAGLDGMDRGLVENLARSENRCIRQMARRVIVRHIDLHRGEEEKMEAEISIPDKILHLKGIQIFEGLSVSELAAIAAVTEEVAYPANRIVINEGEPGETMYMIVKGEVAVIKGHGTEREMELDRIGAGDYFGEMALFEDTVRSATIRTREDSHLLVLHKREFTESVREYPQIALHICKELASRIRRLHEKLEAYEK